MKRFMSAALVASLFAGTALAQPPERGERGPRGGDGQRQGSADWGGRGDRGGRGGGMRGGRGGGDRGGRGGGRGTHLALRQQTCKQQC